MDKNVEKERLLKEIKYYTNRIENLHKESKSRLYFDSSDSEDDFPTFRAPGPSISELRTTESGLRTSLQATQELTNLTVLEYETIVMVEPPKIKRGSPITEPGIWREVRAECRIDAIPFSITFCTHQGNKKFAPILYRNLYVLPIKKIHEVELAQSVLPDLTRPSDVIEVLKSFATAFRSRRTSLARLAKKYTTLQLEPATEGGYLLKCGSVLSITWRLENKWTPLTPFHHKMKFELDYMDVEQLKIIKQAHKKISDPTITTDERTLLLAKIISTCLELKATQDESMESETESTRKAERTIIEDAPDDNLIIEHENQNNLSRNSANHEENNEEGDRDVNVEREKEKEIMAPPKSLPKKAKPKGKENKVDNSKSLKRTSDEAGAVAKKAKINENNIASENSRQVSNEIEVAKDKNPKNLQNKQKSIQNQVSNTKKSNKNTKTDDNVGQNQNTEPKNDKTFPNTVGNSKQNTNKQVKSKNGVENQSKTTKLDQNKFIEKNVNKNKVQKANVVDRIDENNKQNLAKVAKTSQTEATQHLTDSNKQKNKQSIAKESTTNTQTDKNKQIVSKNVAKNSMRTKNQVKTSTDSEKTTKTTGNLEITTKTNERNGKSTTDVKKSTIGIGKTTKPSTDKPSTDTDKTKSNSNAVKNNDNVPKSDSKNTKLAKNPISGPSTSKSTENLQKNGTKQINIGKNIQNNKNTEQNKVSDPKNNQKVQKNLTNEPKKQTLNKKSNIAITNNVDKSKLTIKSHSNLSKIKKPGNIGEKNLKGVVKPGNHSKIPLKKLVTSTPVNFMWVSPRNHPSTSDTNSLTKTNIPRILNKPWRK